jgi:hypothetical protein
MAIVALEAAVDAVAEGFAVDGDAVAIGILHGSVAMATEALGLRMEPAGSQSKQQHGQAGSQKSTM